MYPLIRNIDNYSRNRQISRNRNDAPETLNCTETKIIEEETDTEITL